MSTNKNTELFLKQLEEVVRKVVKQELKTISENAVVAAPKQSAKDKIAEIMNEPPPTRFTPVKPPAVPKQYTTNSTLNELLNMTRPITEDGPTVASSMGDTSLAASIPEGVPAPIKEALTKDYSSFMKKLNEKKKSGSSLGRSSMVGQMDPSIPAVPVE